MEKMNRQSAAKHDLVFKPFPIYLNGYEKKYKVCNNGKIWSEYLQDFLKPYHSKGGYLRVKINFGDRNKKFMVHRLVAMAFIRNDDPEKLTQVDHINNDRNDNRVENLRWLTPKQNTYHAIEQGNRDWYEYEFINSETGEILKFRSAIKICKYFNIKSPYNTIIKYSNSNIPVEAGKMKGWIINRTKIVKVQRLSSAEEQGQVVRNGNNPIDKEFLSRVLIQSDLYRNIELSQINYIRPALRDGYKLTPYTEQHGSYQCWSVRADQSC